MDWTTLRPDLQLHCKYIVLGSPQTEKVVDMGLANPNSVMRVEAYASTASGSTIIPVGGQWGGMRFSVFKEAGNLNMSQFNPSEAFTRAWAYVWYSQE